MAKNLLKSLTNNDELHIFDVSEHAISTFTSVQTSVPIYSEKSVGDLAQKSDIIISMLPAPKHVDLVYNEIFQALDSSSNKVFIESSTIDIATSLKHAKTAHNLGFFFFDAPVSGGVVGATNGSLTFMVGGGPLDDPSPQSQPPSSQSIKVYKNDVTPTLSAMGTNIVPCGGPGLGLAAKLSNNYLLALTNIACSESFALAKALGLSLPLYSKIVASSTGRCWSSDVNNPVPDILASAPSSRHYLNGFGVQLMKKDLGLAIDAAKQTNLPLLLADSALDVYSDVEKVEDFKDKDMSVIYQYIDQLRLKN